MISYKKISSRPVKPYNIYLYNEEPKKNFLAQFGENGNSFEFMHYLIRWCCEFNEGNWPDEIGPKIIERMSKDAVSPIQVENSKIFKDGYIIKNGDHYELTHELIILTLITCGDGNFIPVSTGHIDFTQEDKFTEFFRDQMQIGEPQAVTFLIKLLLEMSKKRGQLIDEPIDLGVAILIARENNLIFDLCIEWARRANLINVDLDEDNMICNALVYCAYCASPKLN